MPKHKSPQKFQESKDQSFVKRSVAKVTNRAKAWEKTINTWGKGFGKQKPIEQLLHPATPGGGKRVVKVKD